jgi:hypothetical protein
VSSVAAAQQTSVNPLRQTGVKGAAHPRPEISAIFPKESPNMNKVLIALAAATFAASAWGQGAATAPATTTTAPAPVQAAPTPGAAAAQDATAGAETKKSDTHKSASNSTHTAKKSTAKPKKKAKKSATHTASVKVKAAK